MHITQEVIAQYRDKGLAVFTLRVHEEFNEKHQKWKKAIDAPSKWQETDKHSTIVVLKKHNAVGVLTGEKSGVFVLDIDALEHWIEWLKNHERHDEWFELEKTLVTAETASGGLHYYFLYTPALAKIKGTSKCFGGHWEVDSRTNGNFVFAPPTKLINDNVKWEYKWVRSVFEHPLVEMPSYLVEWLITRPGKVKTMGPSRVAPRVAHPSRSIDQQPVVGHRTEHGALIEAIVRLIDISKWDKYNDWLAIGINLKSLRLPEEEKFDIFKVVSQVSGEYQEGCCEMKWNNIPVNDHCAAENILRSWARQGDPFGYGALTGEKTIETASMEIVRAFVHSRFGFDIPLISGGIVKRLGDASYILVNIEETYCTIHGGEHDEVKSVNGVELKRPNNPYIVIGDKHARLKCHNSACRAKRGDDLLFTDYTDDLKAVVKKLLKNETRALVKNNTHGRSCEAMVHPPSTYSNTDIEKLLKLLSPERFTNRKLTEQLCGFVHSCGTHLGSVLFEFGKTYPGWDEELAKGAWAKAAKNDNMDVQEAVNTLFSWGREDNPMDFLKWHDFHVPSLALRVFDHGDRGLAQIAHDQLKNVVKMIPGMNKRTYYSFDDSSCLWKQVNDGMLKMRINEVLEGILFKIFYRTGFAIDNEVVPEQKKQLENRLQNCMSAITYIRSNRGLGNVVALASELFVDLNFENRLDSVRYLLGVQNGVIDLRTGELRDRAPEDMIYRISNVVFDLNADTTWFNGVILSMMADDEDMTAFLQKLLGYCISGEVSQHILPCFTAAGRNGKSLLMNALKHILGGGPDGFYKQMSTAVIVDVKATNLQDEIRKGKGGRVWAFNELGQDQKLRYDTAQMITGGDSIPVQGKYVASETLTPYQKCIITTNYLPELDSVTPALAERFLCIEFPVFFTDLTPDTPVDRFTRQKDETLQDKVMADLPGVLKWLVDGSIAWYKAPRLKMQAPPAVRGFTERYFVEQDTLMQFLRNGCETGRDFEVNSTELLDAYIRFLAAEDRSEKVTPQKMTKLMGEKGYKLCSNLGPKKNGRGYKGVRVKASDVVESSPFIHD